MTEGRGLGLDNSSNTELSNNVYCEGMYGSQ